MVHGKTNGTMMDRNMINISYRNAPTMFALGMLAGFSGKGLTHGVVCRTTPQWGAYMGGGEQGPGNG